MIDKINQFKESKDYLKNLKSIINKNIDLSFQNELNDKIQACVCITVSTTTFLTVKFLDLNTIKKGFIFDKNSFSKVILVL